MFGGMKKDCVDVQLNLMVKLYPKKRSMFSHTKLFQKAINQRDKMKVWSSENSSILEWCPIRENALVYASATPSTITENPTLTLNKFNFLQFDPTPEPIATFESSSPFTTLSWTTYQNQDFGLLSSGHADGSIDLYLPSQKSKVASLNYNNSDITCLKFNPTQSNVLLSVSANNEICIWDVTNPENGKRCSTGANRAITGKISAVSWHRKPSLSYFVAFCDSTGLCTVWDLRQNRSTHNFADSTFKSELSDITFAPLNPTLLATASPNPRNSVVTLWDLRNPTTPSRKLHGHSSGVTKLEWPSCDERVLLSAGKDGNIIAWNIETGEQLRTVFENNAPISQLSWSPFYHGAVLASGTVGTQLYSFADPAMGVSSKLQRPHYHYRPSGVDVAFDGRVFQYNEKKIHSFVHQEQIAEASDFVHFVEALEQNSLPQFVNEKIESSQDETEKELWEICSLAMNPDTFKQKILNQLGVANLEKLEERIPVHEESKQETESGLSSSAALFNDVHSTDEADAAFAFTSIIPDPDENVFNTQPDVSIEEEVFSEAMSPFHVVPKKDKDEAAYFIAQSLISGNLKEAIECCFRTEKYTEALLIASCGPADLLQKTCERYIRKENTTLTTLISYIAKSDLENFAKYAKTSEWKEAFSVLINYSKSEEEFQKSVDILGRRLIAQQNDYKSAYKCFVASKNYEMVQECLFQIYQTIENKDSSSASVALLVLEKLLVMAGKQADNVIEPIARTFLQHVIQSGHKDEAIRFIEAIGSKSRLQELKAVLVGQQQPTQPVQQQYGYPSQRPVAQQSSNQYFVPQAQAPPQPTGQTGVFIPQKLPGYGQPPPPATTTPSTTAAPPPAAPNLFVPKPSLPPASGQPGYSVPTYSGPGLKPPQNPIRPPPPGPVPVAAPPTTSSPMYSPVQQPPSNDFLAPPPQEPPTIVAPPTMPTFTPMNVPSYQMQNPAQPAAKPAPPPPIAAPNIAVPPPPPSVSIPQPRYEQPSMPPPMGLGQPNPMQPPPSVTEPPPMAQANINAPPPITVVPPPVPTQMIAPNATYSTPAFGQPQPVDPRTQGQYPQAPQTPPPPAQLPPDATIDEVPDQFRQLAQDLVDLVHQIEERQDLKNPNKKAIADAAQKLPLVFGLFRDNKVSEKLSNDLAIFLQKINAGDLAEANQIRKSALVEHMANCRDVVILMNYITNALKSL